MPLPMCYGSWSTCGAPNGYLCPYETGCYHMELEKEDSYREVDE